MVGTLSQRLRKSKDRCWNSSRSMSGVTMTLLRENFNGCSILKCELKFNNVVPPNQEIGVIYPRNLGNLFFLNAGHPACLRYWVSRLYLYITGLLNAMCCSCSTCSRWRATARRRECLAVLPTWRWKRCWTTCRNCGKRSATRKSTTWPTLSRICGNNLSPVRQQSRQLF